MKSAQGRLYSSIGFTLIELMVAMAVATILGTIALFGFNKAKAAARDVQRVQFMKGIQIPLQRYNRDRGRYPKQSDYGGCGNDFCSLVLYLSGAGCFNAGDQLNYLDTTTLIDPGNKLDVCGSPPGACGLTNPTCSGATYTAVSGGSSYTLTLTKEAGGTAIFNNP